MKERGKYSILLDNVLLNNDKDGTYFDKKNGLSIKYLFPAISKCLETMSQDNEYSLELGFIVELIDELLHVNDYENLATLLDLAFNKEYFEFCKLFYNPLHNKIESDLLQNNTLIKTNIFNNMVFVTSNRQLLIDSIRAKGYNVSEGPQKWRGHINSINSFLNYLDTDYRNSLYQHYIHHKNMGSLPEYAKDYPLKKEHFFFRNIHNNLGNIRW